MIRTFAASLALVLGFAADARAGDLALAFGKHSEHGSFGISLSNRGVGLGFGAPAGACRPVVYQAPRTVWVPGRYEVVHEKVWIEGRREKVWVAAHKRVVCDAYGRTRTVWEPGRWQIVETPGHWETRAVQVWRPGHHAPQPVVGYARRGY
jgi:hypothetical protein